MSAITTTEVKTYLSIADTTYDAKISALIPWVESELFYGHLHRVFVDSDGVDQTPLALKITLSQMIKYHLGASIEGVDETKSIISSVGDLTYKIYTASDQVAGYPPGVINAKVLNSFRIMSRGWSVGANSQISGYTFLTNLPLGTGDELETVFEYDGTILANTEQITVGNLPATRGEHYTISGSIITFLVAPLDGLAITLSGWVK